VLKVSDLWDYNSYNMIIICGGTSYSQDLFLSGTVPPNLREQQANQEWPVPLVVLRTMVCLRN
jgi:hypothetical protein